MHKEVVELLVELREVYDLIRDRYMHSCEIEESDVIFLKVYEKYVFGDYAEKIEKKEETLH